VIIKAFKKLSKLGALGINSRNSEYIMRYNPRSRFPLVDNKALTKQLAHKHNIPTPKLYHVIEHHGDIARVKKMMTDLLSFVIKPARGAGGQGIVLIADRDEKGFITSGGRAFSMAELDFHISEILSGIYSLSGLDDSAIIEALIHPAPVFESVSWSGVPDVRIVVYRGVPVMSMVRLPTKASDGKANLHQGAIAAGIDIAKGVTLNAVHKTSIVTHHPDTGNPVSGIKIPFWQDMLLIAAKAHDITGLGYVGVDLIIDRSHGPVLLELNARPGLGIQLANQTGLRARLKKVDRAPESVFTGPETRVAWAMQVFGKDRPAQIS
jgi:alpha-L-glutamate ligase-like protein